MTNLVHFSSLLLFCNHEIPGGIFHFLIIGILAPQSSLSCPLFLALNYKGTLTRYIEGKPFLKHLNSQLKGKRRKKEKKKWWTASQSYYLSKQSQREDIYSKRDKVLIDRFLNLYCFARILI